ncbi:HAD family hydrolase [bacterium CPR1]|nr:HAD family hydrolase [bacterium CPR1]
MPRAVLFDLDNTLVDRDRALRELLADHFADPQDRAALLCLDGDPRFFVAWSERARRPFSQQDLAGQLALRIAPDPELIEALGELGRRCQLGLVSNGGSRSQRAKLRAAGLEELLGAALVVSGEVGLQKPDPEIFWLACRRLVREPHECLFIGDQEAVDGVGARAAGLSFQLARRVLDAETVRGL